MSSISCIIPTYNGKQLLQTHLPQVLKMLRAGDELIITDDASTDDTCEWLQHGFTLEQIEKNEQYLLWGNSITLIQNFQNLRFARNVNQAVLLAKNPHIFLLNSDVSPEETIIATLLPHFADPDVFAVGCLEYEGNSTTAPQAGKNKLWFERGLFQHSKADTFDSGETAWVSGGSGMFDRVKWLELGGFDLNFSPAYWEDVDLSFRARKRGWKVLFEAKAVVFHEHEQTNSEIFDSREIKAMSWKHGEYFTWKHATVIQKMLFLLWKPYWWWKTR